MKKLLGLGLVLALMMPVTAPVFAEGLKVTKSTSNRSKVFRSQSQLLDGRLARQYKSSTRLQPTKKTPQIAATSSSIPRYRGSYRGTYLPVAKTLARKHGIPEDLFLRLVQQESGWKPSAVSHKGAIGLAQLMPGTARLLGVNPRDPKQNLEGGARYLKQMYRKFGSWRLALAAYNAGPGAVEKYNGVPPYRETKNYVKKILGS